MMFKLYDGAPQHQSTLSEARGKCEIALLGHCEPQTILPGRGNYTRRIWKNAVAGL
jgi:hypothetical protein